MATKLQEPDLSPRAENDSTSSGDEEWVNPNREFVKKYWIVMLCTVIFLIVAGVSINSTSGYKDAEATNDAKIEKLTSQIQVQKAANQDAQDKLNSSVSGMSQTRKDSDDAKAMSLMKTATTWGSYADYTNARRKVMDTYDLNETSPFMKTFMPEIKQATDSTGKSYNIIDVNGYNMKFNSIQSSITKVGVEGYSYFALVSVSSTGKDGKGTNTTYDAMTYTVDGDGKISNVTVTPLFGEPSSFGSMGN